MITLSSPSPAEHTTLPTQHTWPSGILCHRTHCFGCCFQMSSEIQAVLLELFNSCWKHFCSCNICASHITGVCDYALGYINLHFALHYIAIIYVVIGHSCMLCRDHNSWRNIRCSGIWSSVDAGRQTGVVALCMCVKLSSLISCVCIGDILTVLLLTPKVALVFPGNQSNQIETWT